MELFSLVTTDADSNGDWSAEITLNDGTFSITATATNEFGTSPASSVLNITIDTTILSTLTEWTQTVLDLRTNKVASIPRYLPSIN